MDENKKNILAIDIGTTSVKALILGADGKVLAEASEPHRLISLHPGWAEEDPLCWKAGVEAALEKLKGKSALCSLRGKGAPDDLAAIGCCGMVPAIVLLDETGQPLRNAILQNDARCSSQIDRLKGEIDQDWLFERTGGFTNQQHVLPRLLWIQENEPEVWAKTAHVMGSYDYVNYLLTGCCSIEKNWAVESGLWNIHKGHWITEILEKYGISETLLGKVHEPSDIVGCTGDDALESFGILGDASGTAGSVEITGVPVIAGSADHVAATLACGITRPGDVLIKFGGAGDILYCTDVPVTDPRLFFDVHDVPGKHLLNGCMAASGSLVKWFVDGILGGEAAIAAGENAGSSVYALLDSEASTLPAGSDGLVVLPYFLGEKTPLMDPNARGVFFGLTLSHTRAHMYRAILESVIYGFRHHLDVLREKGIEPARIYAADGGARSPLWCQIAADILGRPVAAFQDGTGSAYGTALLAGYSVGLIKDLSDVSKLFPQPVLYEPNPENVIVYNKTYSVYIDLYTKTKDLMHLL